MNYKKWLSAAIIVLLLFGVFGSVQAADVRGRLFVEVKNTKGEPLQNVKITLVSEVSASKTYNLETDKKGKAKIVGIDPDLYKTTAVLEGYQDKKADVKLRPGLNVKEEWVLKTLAEAQEEADKAKAEAIKNAMEEMTEEERNAILSEEAYNKGLTALETAAPDDMTQVRTHFEEAIKLNPEIHYFAYLVLGQIAFNAHEVEKAQTYLLKALDLDKEKAAIGDIGSMLGASYMIQENADKAKEIWSQVVQTAPNPTVLYNLAGIEVRASNLDEAMKWLLMSIEKFPDDLNSLQLAGDIYIQKQDYPKALEMYEKLLKAMEVKEGVAPESLKEIQDTVKLLKETAK